MSLLLQPLMDLPITPAPACLTSFPTWHVKPWRRSVLRNSLSPLSSLRLLSHASGLLPAVLCYDLAGNLFRRRGVATIAAGKKVKWVQQGESALSAAVAMETTFTQVLLVRSPSRIRTACSFNWQFRKHTDRQRGAHVNTVVENWLNPLPTCLFALWQPILLSLLFTETSTTMPSVRFSCLQQKHNLLRTGRNLLLCITFTQQWGFCGSAAHWLCVWFYYAHGLCVSDPRCVCVCVCVPRAKQRRNNTMIVPCRKPEALCELDCCSKLGGTLKTLSSHPHTYLHKLLCDSCSLLQLLNRV